MELQRNSPSIYGQPAEGCVYSPFELAAAPMERLMLVNFSGDSVYNAFEPQVFDDETNGRGMLVIAYRLDGTVDVYYQPGVTRDRIDFEVAAGLGAWVETSLEGARFEVSSTGVDVEFAFEDVEGRAIEVSIKELSGKPRKPFALLAPLGSGIEDPRFMPLFFMYDFYFVRRAGTQLSISIDGVNREPDSLPIPVDFSWVYFLRYSADPFIVTWNEAHDGPLTPLQPDRPGEFQDDGVVYDLVENDGHYEIARMVGADDRHEVSIAFSPPVPDLVSLKGGVQVQGRFHIESDETVGDIEGEYQVARRGDTVDVTVQPTSGWRPRERKLSVRLLYLVVSTFKQWVNTYRWTATIDLKLDGPPTMRSGWIRT